MTTSTTFTPVVKGHELYSRWEELEGLFDPKNDCGCDIEGFDVVTGPAAPEGVVLIRATFNCGQDTDYKEFKL